MNDFRQQDNMPLVSVIIPVYNRKEMCKDAIFSALNQDYPNIEVIVGDNKSTDGTFEYLQKAFENEQRVKLFQNEANLGPVGNWEECIKRSSGEYIKILWSDDLMSPRFVSRGVELMENNRNLSFVYSCILFFETTESVSDPDFLEQGNRIYRDGEPGIREGEFFIHSSNCESYKMPVSPGCAIFRSDKLKIDKRIPNKMNYDHRKTGAGIDLFVFFNSLEDGGQYYYLNEPMNYFRVHKGSISCFDEKIDYGYWTAKIQYIHEHNRFAEDMASLKSEMISKVFYKNPFKKNNIFQKKKVRDYLLLFYDESEADYSIKDVFKWEIKKKKWLKSL
ncbi:MAG: glycosyltransferase family 2 protein [Lachnospiraceae bacterium]|nr:glycosyltransferase family 2 protein [Lachnospiraceae bacterium]